MKENERSINKMKVFVSYKWGTNDHNDWVEKFAADLREADLDVRLDKWNVRLGGSFIEYMTTEIHSSNIVLLIINEDAVKALEKGNRGGLIYEMELALSLRISGEKVRIIGILREGNNPPTQLRDRRYIDFRDTNQYPSQLSKLIVDIFRSDGVEFNGPLPNWQPRNIPAKIPFDQYKEFTIENFFQQKLNKEINKYSYPRSNAYIKDIVPGRWLGVTGGLWLEVKDNLVVGEYDWGSKKSFGSINGVLIGNVMQFNWKWKDSSKNGNGFFTAGHHLYGSLPFANTLENLIGGWFFDHQKVQIIEIIDNPNNTIIHPWMFFREGSRQYLGTR